jgi:hypothetical protein
MFKKITALLILFLFAGQLTASFLHFDCNMACCQKSVDSCCTIEVVEKECSVMGKNCAMVVFLPIISGPSAHAENDNELSKIELTFINLIAEITNSNIVDYFEIHPLAEPPPAFNLPLLI